MTRASGAAADLLSSWWRGDASGRAAGDSAPNGAPAPAAEDHVGHPHDKDNEHAFRAIHARFGRNVLGIYGAVSVVALGALVVALVSDLQYQKGNARDALFVETQLRAQYLGQYLGLLADEVRRIGARPEIDLLDNELGPERTLLDSLRGKRGIFSRGIALLDDQGTMVWSTPEGFVSGNQRPVPAVSLALLSQADGVADRPGRRRGGDAVCRRAHPAAGPIHRRAAGRYRSGGGTQRRHRIRTT